jgi:peptidoglycan/LPS O-acetylase OafA/YrhL
MDHNMPSVLIHTRVRVAQRVDFVDGIRAAASIYVVLHHIWLTAYPNYLTEATPNTIGWLAFGQISVAVFIVLSGFSLGLSPARQAWKQPQYLEFIRRRAWRILPTYWAALALSCLIFGLITPQQTGSRVSLKAIVVHSLLLQDVVDSPKPNGTFWSIAVEFQIYFLFPLFVLLLRRAGSFVMIICVTSAIVVGYLAAENVQLFHRFLNITPQFICLFVMGMASAAFVARDPNRSAGRALMVAAVLLGSTFLALCVVLGVAGIEPLYFWVDLIVGGSAACLLAAMLHGRATGLRRFFELRHMRNTGLYSYSIYCVHLPILFLVWTFLVSRIATRPLNQFALLLGIGVPVVLVFSRLFSNFFEQPFLTHRSFRSLKDLLLPKLRRPCQKDSK